MKFPKIEGVIFFTLAIVGLFLVHPIHALPRFMTLPLDDLDVHIQQGWLYDFIPQEPLCTKRNPDYPYCHYGIDYIKGEIDNSKTWLPFDVLAVAGGSARYLPNGSKSWGNYVITKHTIDGVDFYTINAHLKTSSLPPQKWVDIKRGQPIGTAGKSGQAAGLLHLHFEVYQDGLQKKNRLDPYDVYKTKIFYPPYGSCGGNFLWTECPPISPSRMDDDFNDNFLNPALWSPTIDPPGSGTIVETNQQLEMRANPGPSSQGVMSSCGVSGNFDLQVDFRLLIWPLNNRRTVRFAAQGLTTGPFGHVGVLRVSYDSELYQFRSESGVVDITTSDASGTLRLVRMGTTVSGYYHNGSNFVLIGSDSTDTNDTRVLLDFSSPEVTATSATIAFDNHKVNAGTVSCP